MKTIKATVLTLLTLGFLWLGVPRCSEVETLDKQERQQVEYLCRMVLLEHLQTVTPEMLTVKEWKFVVSEYRRAEAADARDLERQVPDFPNHVGDVVDRLARRLRR